MSKVKEYSAAVEAKALATKRRDVTFREAFPLGSRVRWTHGRHMQFGTVKMFCYQDRLIATNDRSGKDVPVDGYNLLAASQADGGVE
jgi:hypothetical protein